jgi:hypothetical protein
MNQQVIIAVLIGALILYRIFLRVRRSIDWKRLVPGNLLVKTVILSVLGLVFLAEGFSHTISLISDAVGILLGFILAYYGAGKTRFEQRGGQWYFRPNLWIEGFVTVLFLGRLIYRIYDMMEAGAIQGHMSLAARAQSMFSGWTAGLMLIMFAYYAVYNLLLIRGQNRLSGARSR